MHTTYLRRVGGSAMIAVPPALLDVLNLNIGEKVGLTIHNGQLMVKPRVKPKYNLEDLLAQCDPDAELTQEDQQWVDAGPVGREII